MKLIGSWFKEVGGGGGGGGRAGQKMLFLEHPLLEVGAQARFFVHHLMPCAT